ncbi:hypothetical protein [Streptomyces sp. HD]|nr:hypothetical protein [Streptomyces sp. HD]MDC0766025.1 hypothetical protein [Streptomyces sp. HD]
MTAVAVYVALYALWAAALGHSIRAHLKEGRTAEAEPAEGRQPVGAA